MKFLINESQYNRLLSEQNILQVKYVNCDSEFGKKDYNEYLNKLALSETFDRDLKQLQKNIKSIYENALREGAYHKHDKYFINGLFSDYGFKSYEEAKKSYDKYLGLVWDLGSNFIKKYSTLYPKWSVLKKLELFFHHPHKKINGYWYNSIVTLITIPNYTYTIQPIECIPDNKTKSRTRPLPPKKVVKRTSSTKKPDINSFAEPTPKPDITVPKTNDQIKTTTIKKEEPIKTNFSATFGWDNQQETKYFKNFDEWKKFHDSTKGKFGLIDANYNNSETNASMSLKGSPSDWGL